MSGHGESPPTFNPYQKFNGVFVPEAMLSYRGLKANAKLLYGQLCRYAGKNGDCHPSQARLARDMGLTVSGINGLLAQLVSEGFIKREAPGPDRVRRYDYDERELKGGTTRYYFLLHPILKGSMKKKK